MSSPVNQIRNGFAAISAARTGEGIRDAYADFHRLLEAEKPEPETIMSASRQNERALQATRQVRVRSEYENGQPIHETFRGSGIIVVGNKDGELLATGYAKDLEDRDRVDEAYRETFGPYQRVGLRKAAQAAMLHALGYGDLDEVRQYILLQTILESEELAEGRHYAGYSTGRSLVVGASGMLATDAVLHEARQRPWFPDYLEDAWSRGEIESPASIDVLAGWFDHIAAQDTITIARQDAGRFMARALFPNALQREHMNLS